MYRVPNAVTTCACACGTLDAATNGQVSEAAAKAVEPGLISAIANSPLSTLMTGSLTGYGGLPLDPAAVTQFIQSSLWMMVVFLGVAVVASQIVGITRLRIGEQRLKKEGKFKI